MPYAGYGAAPWAVPVALPSWRLGLRSRLAWRVAGWWVSNIF